MRDNIAGLKILMALASSAPRTQAPLADFLWNYRKIDTLRVIGFTVYGKIKSTYLLNVNTHLGRCPSPVHQFSQLAARDLVVA